MMVSRHQEYAVSELAARVEGGLDLRVDEMLSAHTTYGVGGPARLFVVVEDTSTLGTLLTTLNEQTIDWLVLGNGSNVLFADAGFDGCVIKLGRGLDGVSLERDATSPGVHHLRVGAATPINRMLRKAKGLRVSGLECLGGIPGTLGGAVRMNAGTSMGELKDVLVHAEVLTSDGIIHQLNGEELGLSYRSSVLPHGSIVTGAVLRCGDYDPERAKVLADVLTYRKQTQPLQLPSCGSVFANPPGDHAGRLIEASGLKGHQIGGAQVSELHANWIVNVRDASADDVRALIDHCIQTVRADHQVTLRHEVRMLGDWEAV